MRKVLYVIAIVLSLPSMAQDKKIMLSVTPKAGVNVSTLIMDSDDDPDKFDNRVGLYMGAELKGRLSKRFSLSLGAMLSQQGCRESMQDYKSTVKMDYIDLPFLVHFYLGAGISVNAGVEPGFIINSRIKETKYGVTTEGNLEETLSATHKNPVVRSSNMSIPVGISYENRNVVLDATYFWGQKNVLEIISADMHSNGFRITLGYKFDMCELNIHQMPKEKKTKSKKNKSRKWTEIDDIY